MQIIRTKKRNPTQMQEAENTGKQKNIAKGSVTGLESFV